TRYRVLCHCFFSLQSPSPAALSTLSLHDALPICVVDRRRDRIAAAGEQRGGDRTLIAIERSADAGIDGVTQALHDRSIAQREARSEEHTSELQSRFDLVCRLLLEKKKKQITYK